MFQSEILQADTVFNKFPVSRKAVADDEFDMQRFFNRVKCCLEQGRWIMEIMNNMIKE